MLNRLMLLLIIATTSLVHAREVTPSVEVVTTPSGQGMAVAAIGDVATIYGKLQSKSPVERARFLSVQSGSLQAAVWGHHLLESMTRYPELTTAQLEVLYDALSLFTPEFFEIASTDPRWSTEVDLPIRGITSRAQRLFPAPLARALFIDLGSNVAASCEPEILYPASVAPPRLGGHSLPAQPDTPTCTCSSSSDWCDGSGLGFYYCKGGGCYWTSSGCGTFWRYACTGMCAIRQG